MVSIPSMRRRAPSLALLALLATAVNRVGASEETLVAAPLVVSGAAGPDPDPVSCAAEFFPADFDRDGTLAPCFRVAAMRDDDVNDGAEEEAQLCSACVDAVGDVLLPRMLAARMDPTIADAVTACLFAALPAATDAGVPVFAVVDRCDLLSLGAAGALSRNTPEVEKATEPTAFEPTEPTELPEPIEPTELPEPTRPKPEPRPRDPRYPDTGLTAAADAAEAIDGDEERSKKATPGATTAVFAADAADEKGEPPSPSPPPKRRRGLSDGAIVSIVIVCVAGSVLPISLLVACVHARRRKREEKLVRDLEGAG